MHCDGYVRLLVPAQFHARGRVSLFLLPFIWISFSAANDLETSLYTLSQAFCSRKTNAGPVLQSDKTE